ncbi:Salt Induced Serine rich [Hibiscus trionum]|uniref:Salt Induced Serine rich n=1 Tax=Hibiscus trionum TaxID=183268 RepID=A0A9W7I7L5_HIBTR|nr:Salt Induced Serine rich [Hibiscus trionum]
MENKKQVSTSSSSSSFDHLFGPKDPSSSSKTGIFGTIFPPPSMVLGRKSIGSGGQSSVTTEPCNLCSSIHYGGQENYYSLNTTTTDSLNYLKKNEEDDDINGSNSSGASRGNWWQGSLYY